MCDVGRLLNGRKPEVQGDRIRAAIPTYYVGAGNQWEASDQVQAEETTIPDNLCAYVVRGDSMDPLVWDKQSVLALEGVEPDDGDLAYIELKDNRCTFKRVHKIGARRWLLISVNSHQDPIMVKESEIRRAHKAWGVKF